MFFVWNFKYSEMEIESSIHLEARKEPGAQRDKYWIKFYTKNSVLSTVEDFSCVVVSACNLDSDEEERQGIFGSFANIHVVLKV